MGVNQGDRARGLGDVSPRIWSAVDANANCPPPQILSCFNSSNTRLLALQCSNAGNAVESLSTSLF